MPGVRTKLELFHALHQHCSEKAFFLLMENVRFLGGKSGLFACREAEKMRHGRPASISSLLAGTPQNLSGLKVLGDCFQHRRLSPDLSTPRDITAAAVGEGVRLYSPIGLWGP